MRAGAIGRALKSEIVRLESRTDAPQRRVDLPQPAVAIEVDPSSPPAERRNGLDRV